MSRGVGRGLGGWGGSVEEDGGVEDELGGRRSGPRFRVVVFVVDEDRLERLWLLLLLLLLLLLFRSFLSGMCCIKIGGSLNLMPLTIPTVG